MMIAKYKILEDKNPILMRAVLLAENEEYAYVYMDEDQLIYQQPEEIEFEVIESLPEDIIIAEKQKQDIKNFIGRYIDEKIRDKYSLNDELYFARISIGALKQTYELESGEAEELEEYQTFVEEAREWGRQQRRDLGIL